MFVLRWDQAVNLGDQAPATLLTYTVTLRRERSEDKDNARPG